MWLEQMHQGIIIKSLSYVAFSWVIKIVGQNIASKNQQKKFNSDQIEPCRKQNAYFGSK